MGEVVEFRTEDASIISDTEGRHLDVYGHVLLSGIFSDLCRHRDSESNQERANELDGIAKRVGKVLERYEPTC